jgi:DNA-binding NarL/FixJ family response regulator
MSFKILIADDNAAVRRLLKAFIERDEEMEWHICGEAENGQIAVDQVKESNPDVVILDLQMPVMNGLEAARQIAQIAPQTALAMLTLHAQETVLQEARAVGIQRVFCKSQTLSHLIDWLKTLALSRTIAQRDLI